MAVQTDHGRGRARREGAPTVQTKKIKRPDDPDTIGGKTDADAFEDGKIVDVNDDDDQEMEPEGPLALQRALREVEASVDAELVALLESLEEMRATEEGLQEKLEQLYLELGSVQDGLAGNAAEIRKSLTLRRDVASKRYDMQATTVQRTLLTGTSELVARDRAWREQMEAAEARVRAFKEDPELASRLEEFRKLDERMDTLELLPETYRGVVQDHHAVLKKQLEPHLAPPAAPTYDALRLGVAVAVTMKQGEDGANSGRLLAVLPVEFPTHDRARQGKSDLQARFAFRVLAALSRFVVNIGARSETKAVDLGGLLGIELPINDLDVPVGPADLARALRDSFADARDNQMARVNVSTDMVFVPMQALTVMWRRAEAAREAAATPRSRSKAKKTRK